MKKPSYQLEIRKRLKCQQMPSDFKLVPRTFLFITLYAVHMLLLTCSLVEAVFSSLLHFLAYFSCLPFFLSLSSPFLSHPFPLTLPSLPFPFLSLSFSPFPVLSSFLSLHFYLFNRSSPLPSFFLLSPYFFPHPSFFLLSFLLSPFPPPLFSPAPLSKEGLWQNWMSTSGCAQLESEVHLHNGSLHATHSHYSHYHYGDGAEGDSGYGDSLKSCPPSCECGHDHGATTGSSATAYASSYGSQGGYVCNR